MTIWLVCAYSLFDDVGWSKIKVTFFKVTTQSSDCHKILHQFLFSHLIQVRIHVHPFMRQILLKVC